MKNATRTSGWLLAGLFSVAAILISFRWVALFFLALWLVTLALRPGLRNQWSIAAILIGFILCCFQPFDISFETRRGPPRIVPAIYGKPTKEAMNKAERGEVLLKGCVANGFEPDWVLVW
jgi:hypothetical protein